jgi:hypothetical protein
VGPAQNLIVIWCRQTAGQTHFVIPLSSTLTVIALTIAAKLRGPIAASSSSAEEESISRCKKISILFFSHELCSLLSKKINSRSSGELTARLKMMTWEV